MATEGFFEGGSQMGFVSSVEENPVEAATWSSRIKGPKFVTFLQFSSSELQQFLGCFSAMVGVFEGGYQPDLVEGTPTFPKVGLGVPSLLPSYFFLLFFFSLQQRRTFPFIICKRDKFLSSRSAMTKW